MIISHGRMGMKLSHVNGRRRPGQARAVQVAMRMLNEDHGEVCDPASEIAELHQEIGKVLETPKKMEGDQFWVNYNELTTSEPWKS